MTVTQYIRHMDMEKVKRELKILDNTNDELLEVLPGVIAFMDNLGRIRVINTNTFEEINEKPLDIVGIIDEKILVLSTVQSTILNLDNKKTLVIDTDTYEKILEVDEELAICGRLIYSLPSGVVDKEFHDFNAYNTHGELIYKTKTGFGRQFEKIGTTNIYYLTYGYIEEHDYTNNHYRTCIIRYNNLNNSCEEIVTLDYKFGIRVISEDIAVIQKPIEDYDVRSAIINFKEIACGNSRELNKLIYL